MPVAGQQVIAVPNWLTEVRIPYMPEMTQVADPLDDISTSVQECTVPITGGVTMHHCEAHPWPIWLVRDGG